jgi:hypothetical protein
MITHTRVLRMARRHDHILEYLLLAMDTIAEFCVAAMLGIACGWLLGFYVGRTYVEQYQPVYFSQFDSLTEVSEWSLKPFRTAIIGGYVGGTVGTIIAVAIHVRGCLRK